MTAPQSRVPGPTYFRFSLASAFLFAGLTGILVIAGLCWLGIPHAVRAGLAGSVLTGEDLEKSVKSIQTAIVPILVMGVFIASMGMVLLTMVTRKQLDHVIRELARIREDHEPIALPGSLDPRGAESGNEVARIAFIGNGLARDLKDLTLQAQAIAEGDLDNDILNENVTSKLGAAFRRMVLQLKELGLIARTIASEKLGDPLLDRARQGTIGSSYQEMIKRLRHLLHQADAIAQGRLSDTILEANNDGELSRAFHAMARNLRLLARQTEAVASKDLTDLVLQERLPGEVGDSLARMFEVLENLVKMTQKTIVQLATSSRELAALSDKQSEMAGDQAEATNLTSGTMQDLSVGGAQVVASVEQVLKAAMRMVKGCRETQERSQAMMGILEETISVGEDNLARVKRLEEGSRKIVGVTAIISELAKETRVLGVNAAIMAAQAGENAGGFTVVAREIRRLATKTVGATKEIKDYVLSIQKSITDVVKSTTLVQERSRDGGLKARESTQTMEELLGISNQVAHASQSIETNIKDQQSTIEGVLETIRSMDEHAGSFSLTAREIQDLARHLETSAEELRGLIAEFRV